MTDRVYQYIGFAISRIRDELGLTQEELAEIMELSRASVANTEAGRQKVLIETVYTLALKLGIPVQYFFPTLEQLEEWHPDPVERPGRGRPLTGKDPKVPKNQVAKDRICVFDGCSKPVLARGYCRSHYQQLKTKGTVTQTNQRNKGRVCSADGCVKPATAKGYCQLHYRRVTRIGSVKLQAREKKVTPCVKCGEPAAARGLCMMHYQQLRREHGGNLK